MLSLEPLVSWLSSGTCQEALDSFLVKRSYTSIRLSLADASYWPNKGILRQLKAEGPARMNSFQFTDRFREAADHEVFQYLDQKFLLWPHSRLVYCRHLNAGRRPCSQLAKGRSDHYKEHCHSCCSCPCCSERKAVRYSFRALPRRFEWEDRAEVFGQIECHMRTSTFDNTLLSPILPSLKEIQANGVPFAGGTRVSIEPSDLLWTVASRRDQLMQRTGIVGVGSYPPTVAIFAVNGHAYEQVLFTDCAVHAQCFKMRTHLYLCLMVMPTQSILPETTLNI